MTLAKKSESAHTAALDGAALAIVVVLSFLLVLNVQGLGRVLLALAFLLYVPGRAVVTNWPSARAKSELALPVVLSISILAIISVVVLWLGEWHPLALFGIEAVASAAAIVVSLGRFIRGSRSRSEKGWTDPNDHRYSDLANISDITGDTAVASTGWARRWRGWAAGKRVVPPDLLLPLAVGLWAWGISQINTGHLGGLGLVPALPVTYFLGIGLLVVSAGFWLAAARPSSLRLTVHVIAFAVMLYGTASLVYSEPRYAWLYKHVGVVQYIATHGHLLFNVDIYQDWPGFFALVAWFDRIAGISSPLAVAAWAQLFFNLLNCLVFGFATRALPLTWRERWLAIIFFEGANWVAQDYFSPQAASFVVSLGVLAIALHWCQADAVPSRLKALGGRLHGVSSILPDHHRLVRVTADAERPEEGSYARGALIAIVVVFTALVIMHELSPYVIGIQIGLLTVVGKVRPRWLAPLLLAVAVAYLVPHFEFVNHTYGLLRSIGNFFSNARPPAALGLHLSHDQLLIAYAARLLSVIVWVLALVGIWRRLRAGRPVLTLAALAFSPFLLLGFQPYGGEAILRVQLFSLPWSACLAASALSPQPIGTRNVRWLLSPVALLLIIALFLPAYFGSDSLNTVSADEIAASVYLYSHARPGTVLFLDQDFPLNIGARYDLFPSKDLLGADEPPGGFVLSRAATATITDAALLVAPGATSVYLVITTAMLRFALAYGLTTSTSLGPLEQALDRSSAWHVFYRRGGAMIYELERRSR
jgi:hypothetical protein